MMNVMICRDNVLFQRLLSVGVTKIGLQTATNTEITMPKVEKDFVGSVTITVTGPAEGT
jgi:hypothetical protein